MIAPAAPDSLRILDEFGRPFQTAVSKKRMELAEKFAEANSENYRLRRLSARYDAAQNGAEYERAWELTDSLDADSANSRNVRLRLVHRSRYEVANNGYAAGIANTYANDLIGCGPQLRMQTGSEGFNRMVERAWREWSKLVRLRQKLWTMARAKHVDGEAFGVIRQNRIIRHPVRLDFVLHETEQCQSVWTPYGESNYIDGIKFDDYGNPVWYDFLREHPGSSSRSMFADLDAEQIPAKYVCHWFKHHRPGQHRGIPETTPTLNVGISARRWREAVVAAAENIADFSLFLKTEFEPSEIDAVTPMTTLDIEKRMMTALPQGWDAFQPKAEQPTSTHAEFSKSLINEQARPHSMPYNKAACDSSSYNYASGRLDHQTYYQSLDIERADCDCMVLDHLFETWFEMAIVAYGWLGGREAAAMGQASNHSWDWPKHQVADIKSEASANDQRLKNGSTSLVETYAAAGEDYEDELEKQAASNGVTVAQQRQINLLLNVPQHCIQQVASVLGIESQQAVQHGTQDPGNAQTDEEDDDDE